MTSAKETWGAAFAAWSADKSAYDVAAKLHDEDSVTARAEGRPFDPELAQRCDEAGMVESNSRFALILIPAPDFGAVMVKMRLLWQRTDDMEGDEHTDGWHRKYPDAVIADMQRLQSEFAEAWLAAWTKDGGSVVIDDDGKAQIGWVTYDFSPNYRAPDPAWPDAVRDNTFLHAQAFHDATMKARFDALKMFPGGVDALKAHMQTKGVRVAVHTTEHGQ
jgi:hypothetical protein